MYWEECGNARGTPAVFLHGGPGGGSSPDHRRHFDPAFYRIILYDQRGAGQSTPLGELADNTTPHLIADLERLRVHLGIERWLIFGGSWGSTLALAYAEAHPQRVLGLVLRGIFLGRPQEIDWFLHGMRFLFPEAWQAFANFLPAEERGDLLAQLPPAAHRSGSRDAHARGARVEPLRRLVLDATARPRAGRALRRGRGRARDRAHRGALLRPPTVPAGRRSARRRRAHPAIPGVIVQGRYDAVCPILSADDLHRAGRRPNTSSSPTRGTRRASRALPRAGRGDQSLPHAAELTGPPVAMIERVELTLVDLKPKVKRTDAIQSFVVAGDADRRDHRSRRRDRHRLQLHHRHRRLVGHGAASPIISRRASSVAMPNAIEAHLARPPVPHPRDDASARSPRSRWRRSTPRFGICAAAVRSCRCTLAAGGAKESCPLYTTEGGWLHIEPAGAGRRRACAPRRRASAAPRSRSAAARRGGRRAALGAVREAVGAGWDIMTDANQGFTLVGGDPPRAPPGERSTSPGSKSRCRPTTSRRTSSSRATRRCRSRSGESLYSPSPVQGIPAGRRVLDRAGRRRAHRRHHAMAEGRAHGGGFNIPVCPHFLMELHVALVLRGAEQPLGRIHSAARHDHRLAARRSATGARTHRAEPGLGIDWDWRCDRASARRSAADGRSLTSARGALREARRCRISSSAVSVRLDREDEVHLVA